MVFCGPFRDDPPTYSLMVSTPGFWSWLVKTLTFVPRIDNPLFRTILLDDIGRFLAESDVRSHPGRMEEMIEAAGGSFHDFATLILEYLRTGIKQPSPNPRFPLDYIHHIFTFIEHAAELPADYDRALVATPVAPLVRALYECGFAEELVSAVLLFCEADDTEDATRTAIDECMKLIGHMSWTCRADLWAEDLLESGFLRALMLITLKGELHKWNLERHARFFLLDQLPSALVYYHAVVALEKSLESTHELIFSDDFRHCVLYEEWQQFFTCAHERVEALEEFVDETVAYKACDNLQCGRIEDRESIAGQCAGCEAFYYCSHRCQKMDWKAGHRTFCHSHRSLLLTQSTPNPPLSFTERLFLRYLLHHKYVNERRSIWAQQVNVLGGQTGNPERAPSPILFTLFDFCRCPPVVTVYDAEVVKPNGTPSHQWDDLVERARRSEGRMQLHGLRIFEHPPRLWVIPLRLESAAGYERLQGLAGRVHVGEVAETGVLGEIDVILGSMGDILEVH